MTQEKYNNTILNEVIKMLDNVKQYVLEQDEENKTLKQIINNTNEEVLKRVSPLGLVNATDAAILLGVKSKNTIYSLMDRHLISEININTLRMTHIDDIKNLVKKQRRNFNNIKK